MRVLIVKTSSMGDVIHTLPALTDAGKCIPNIEFDWVVEENFAEIPKWHPLVKNVIPIRLRHWRKNLFKKTTYQEIKQFRARLREQTYDLIIDAQGLLKSAMVALQARGTRCGGDWQSAREPFASWFYQRKFTVNSKQHAVTRVRSLFAQALNYSQPDTVPDYGVNRQQFMTESGQSDYLVFLHGTTWVTKHWPVEYWCELAKIAVNHHFKVKLPWGNEAELQRAKHIANGEPQIEILPRLDLLAMAKVLAGAKAIVAVDTGLCHLAAALNVPTVSLYGPTNPQLTGAMGGSQVHLSVDFACAPCLRRECTYAQSTSSLYPPCFATLPVERVWACLEAML